MTLPDCVRRGALPAVALGVGSAAVWLTAEGVRVFGVHGIELRTLDARALALLFGPGVAGVGLLFAAALWWARRRFALGVYWCAVLVAVGTELLGQFGSLELSTPPGGAAQVVFMQPDFVECALFRMLVVSLLGLIIVMGFGSEASWEIGARRAAASPTTPTRGESVEDPTRAAMQPAR